MRKTGQHDMFDFLELIADGCIDGGIAVTEQVDPPRTDGIEIAIASIVVKPHAFAAHDGDERVGFVLFHLRAGMPDRLQTAPIELR